MSKALTQERLKELLSYDPETGLFRWKETRAGLAMKGEVAGGRDKKGYRVITIDRRYYRACRLAFLYMTGQWPKFEVDHIGRDKTDDRWANLRDVDHRANEQNKLHAAGATGLRGVSMRRGRFRAHIHLDKTVCLGTFDTAQAAYEAYLAAKRQFHSGFTG